MFKYRDFCSEILAGPMSYFHFFRLKVNLKPDVVRNNPVIRIPVHKAGWHNKAMKKLNFAPSEFTAGELDKYRRLKGYCEHDLKSSVGVVKGFLQILLDEAVDKLDDQHQDFLKKALNGAESALLGIEQKLQNNMPQFKTVWWLSHQDPSGEYPTEIKLLYLNMKDIKDWEAARESYRPTYFFLDTEIAGDQLQDIVQKTGPFFSEIYLLSDSEVDSELIKKLNVKGALSKSTSWTDLLTGPLKQV